MAIDNFENQGSGLSSPGNKGFDIVPSNTEDLSVKPRCVYVGGAGDLKVTMDGVYLTFVDASGILPIRPDRVLATGTSATNIIGLE